MKTTFLLLILAPLAALASQPASSSMQGIPRVTTNHFVREGLYEGGEPVKATVEALRFAPHSGGIERWVVDFADANGKEIGKVAPRFRLRYEPEAAGKKPRFVFNFRSIQAVHMTREQLASLTRKSRFVKEVVLYPPVEEGDVSLELVLRSGVRFETHQPLEKAGRLVLDLMTSP